MTHFGPYLLFDGTCADAMRFYHECLGGELSMTTVGDSPMKAQLPPALHDRIINARLHSALIELSASDWLHPTRQSRQGTTVCLYISQSSFDELHSYFVKLADGAEPDTLDPLRKLPFGSYGALTDKYGNRWMFHGGPE